jgi:hypothetical protein
MFDMNKPSLTLVGITSALETGRLCQLIRDIGVARVYATEEVPMLQGLTKLMRCFTECERDDIQRIAGRIKREPVEFTPLVIKREPEKPAKKVPWMA